MTDFSSKVDTLSDFYYKHINNPDYADFFDTYGLGLAVAFGTKYNVCEPTEHGIVVINQSWEQLNKLARA
jgi:hypothetical protein